MTDLRKELVHLNLMDTYGCPVHIYVREDDVIKVSKALKLVGFRKITAHTFHLFRRGRRIINFITNLIYGKP